MARSVSRSRSKRAAAAQPSWPVRSRITGPRREAAPPVPEEDRDVPAGSSRARPRRASRRSSKSPTAVRTSVPSRSGLPAAGAKPPAPSPSSTAELAASRRAARPPPCRARAHEEVLRAVAVEVGHVGARAGAAGSAGGAAERSREAAAPVAVAGRRGAGPRCRPRARSSSVVRVEAAGDHRPAVVRREAHPARPPEVPACPCPSRTVTPAAVAHGEVLAPVPVEVAESRPTTGRGPSARGWCGAASSTSPQPPPAAPPPAPRPRPGRRPPPPRRRSPSPRPPPSPSRAPRHPTPRAPDARTRSSGGRRADRRRAARGVRPRS